MQFYGIIKYTEAKMTKLYDFVLWEYYYCDIKYNTATSWLQLN